MLGGGDVSNKIEIEGAWAGNYRGFGYYLILCCVSSYPVDYRNMMSEAFNSVTRELLYISAADIMGDIIYHLFLYNLEHFQCRFRYDSWDKPVLTE